VATGSEVHLAMAVHKELTEDGVRSRVVGIPSWHLFERQPSECRDKVFLGGVPILAIEAGVSPGWRPYVGPQVGVVVVDRFGASARGEVVMGEYGLSSENVRQGALDLLGRGNEGGRR